jgi:cytochrome o ubiquinol oxidase subunit 1
MPLYILGLMGATRRMQHYADTDWQPLMIVALAGACVILGGIVLTIVQLVVSIRTRESRRDATGDPWNARTLDWSTASPPPPWNFATLPQVDGLDAWWQMKKVNGGASAASQNDAEKFTVPRPSATGFVISFFAVMFGFAMVWHIWWMALAGLAGIAATALTHAWRTVNEVEVGNPRVGTSAQPTGGAA